MGRFIEVQVLKSFGRYSAGAVVKIAVDGDGQPLDIMWRRRLKDAQTDGCCAVVETEAETTLNPPSRATKRRDQ